MGKTRGRLLAPTGLLQGVMWITRVEREVTNGPEGETPRGRSSTGRHRSYLISNPRVFPLFTAGTPSVIQTGAGASIR